MCRCCGCVGGMWRSRALFRIAASGVGRNTYTPIPVRKLRLYWISLQPRARHTREEWPVEHPRYFAQAPIFCPHFIWCLTLRATRAPCRSQAGPPSNLGVELKADASTFEYERHRACLSVKTSADEPSHVPLDERTLRGAAWSS